MTPTLRAELDRIEDFLLGPEGGALADILSALRGPDFEDIERAGRVKLETSVHIRAAAFPKLKEASVETIPLSDTSAKNRWLMYGPFSFGISLEALDTTGHFSGHIRTAAHVLGLDKGELK